MKGGENEKIILDRKKKLNKKKKEELFLINQKFSNILNYASL